MKHAHTRQTMTNNITTIKENKFDTSNYAGLLSYATTVSLKFKLKYKLNLIKPYLVLFMQLSSASM